MQKYRRLTAIQQLKIPANTFSWKFVWRLALNSSHHFSIQEEKPMKFVYPAVFHKSEEGGYEGFFPDLACCEAKGETLDEAVENANEAAFDWINLELSEEEVNLPPVSEVSDLELKEGDIVRNIQVTIKFMEGWEE